MRLKSPGSIKASGIPREQRRRLFRAGAVQQERLREAGVDPREHAQTLADA